MAEPKIILHFTETSPREERVPDSPAGNGVLPNRVSISNWGLQTHRWVGFFHFLPLLPWLTVAVGSMCAHCTEHCLHPRTSPAWEAMPGHIVALLSSHHVTPEWPRVHGDPKVIARFQLPKACQKTQESKTKTIRLSLSRRQAKTKVWHRFGFYPLLIQRNYSPQPSSFTSSPLAASFSWCLGTGLHSAP